MNNLHKIVRLRYAIEKMSEQLQQIMPDALIEALDRLQEAGNGSVVYRGTKGKIVCRLVPKIDRQNPTLMRLQEEIQAEELRLTAVHRATLNSLSDQILGLREQIAAIEQRKESVLRSEKLLTLKREYNNFAEECKYINPVLAVSLIKKENQNSEN